MTEPRIPPQSIGTERSVLGSIIVSKSALADGLTILLPTDFYLTQHREIFQAILDINGDEQPVDQITLVEHMTSNKREGPDPTMTIMELVESAASVRDIVPHAKILRKFAALRRLIARGEEITAKAYSPDTDPESLIAEAQRDILAIEPGLSQGAYQSISDAMPGTLRDIEAYSKGEVTGLQTGFNALDEMTSGFHPGDLVILAGRPGMYKTAIAMSMALSATKTKHTALVAELEMPTRQLVLRAMCTEARISMHLLRLGRLPKKEFSKIELAAGALIGRKLYIDDTPSRTPAQIAAGARRLKREVGLDLVVVDYMQLMESGTGRTPREQQVAMISRTLKGMAKELGVPVIALSQLNRSCEQREDKRPQLSDLRESGSIEQDADTVLFTYRADAYDPNDDPNTVELIVGKQRNGPLGTVKVGVEKSCFRFFELSDRVEPEDTAGEVEFGWQDRF